MSIVWPYLFVFILLVVAAWLHGALLTLHTWECRRFARRKLRAAQRSDCPCPWAAVTVPCKGQDPGLEANLQAVFEQDYDRFEIIFAVEGRTDPACQIIERLRRVYPQVPSKIVSAGACSSSGQKVHNLLAATRQLPPRIEVLAFLDSDARPHRLWLRALVSGLRRNHVGANTGYRWLAPQTASFANLLVYSVNSAVAGLMGPGGHHFVWGGSWAIHREVFERTGMSQAWQGTLSDDLVATRVLLGAGWQVRFAPRCMALTPASYTLSEAFEFLRRQYVIARRYATGWWSVGLATNTVAQGVLWGSLVFAIHGFGAGNLARVVAGANFMGLYALFAVRAFLRQSLIPMYVPQHAAGLAAASRRVVWLGPLLGLANLGIMWTSAIGSRIRWRGIRYWISPGGRILLLGHHYGPEAAERETRGSAPPANHISESSIISLKHHLHAQEAALRGARTHSGTESGHRKVA